MTTPKWLLSLEAQRQKLALKGLRTSSPNAFGWTTLQRIPSETNEPTLINEIDVRGSRREFIDGVNYDKSSDPSPDRDEITEREAKAYDAHIKNSINAETQLRIFGVVTKKVLKE